MSRWLRRAGHGRTADGAFVTWTVAEGRRGRRWREVVTVGEGIRSSLLLELDAERRFSHLELSTEAGLLTLHPEGDGTLHGNAVTRAGVAHVAGLAWNVDGAILLEGSAVCRAAAVRDGSSGGEIVGLTIELDLRLGLESALVDPIEWADADGLPMLVDRASWPLELDEEWDESG
ncbi:MAG TPA: hypothetical protein VGO64_08010 [Candidatus Limnocylindrales bacterium]|nr:hypothetical protein [Candidatus Limnocylindrales bacterium]